MKTLVTSSYANPNSPFIHGDARGVRGAVVFLRGVDPETARPWDLPPVTVEQRKFDIQRIDGMEQAKVTPNPADLARIKADQDQVNAVRGTAAH